MEYCKKKGILIESYSPIAQAKEKVRNNETLGELAKKYNVTWSHIMLRWQIEKGIISI